MRDRALVSSVLVAGLLAACGGSAAPRSPSPAPASPAAGSAPASPAITSRCTLAPTGGLAAVTIAAPGPLGTVVRTYELHVPRGAGATGPVPLLVSLHGLGANGTVQNSLTGWSAFADEQAQAGSPFIVALPDALSSLWVWGIESYDVAFILDVIANLRASGCVDDSAIYVDGWSAGAYMAQRMACTAATQGATIAAVHSYAGGDPALPGPCRPSRTVPVLLSNGLDDDVVNARLLGFPAFGAWGRRYSCSAPAAPYTAPQQLGGCSAGAAVAWWPIAGFGHLTWSCPADRFWHDRGIWDFLRHRAAPTESVCR